MSCISRGKCLYTSNSFLSNCCFAGCSIFEYLGVFRSLRNLPPKKEDDHDTIVLLILEIYYQESGNGLEAEQYRKLFIGGLSSVTTDETLKTYFSKWGEIRDCVVMKDPSTKRSRGFGFITYSKQSEVDAAMAARPHTIDDKKVDPKRAVPREKADHSEAKVSTKRLYVSGIREDITEQVLEEHFSQFGKVDIIADRNTGKPRGFAFISFDDYDSVDKCVLQKNHHVLNYRCDVKKALSKEEIAKVTSKF
ncbi:unnamed protein product [Gongylonema pulchrum]|uniref:RRM domain-containing protein n=1 Tax=Gongylonema pulchrum TaxID=637853 RepID=A0A3P7MVR3_9BILA|nr:unnamed protein product [Gongylonema pulchrum]